LRGGGGADRLISGPAGELSPRCAHPCQSETGGNPILAAPDGSAARAKGSSTGAVVLICPFQVDTDGDGDFLAGWQLARDFLGTQDGHVATTLHRSLRADAEFRFVDVSPFRSAREWRAANTHPDRPRRPQSFPSHPCLYEVAREDARAAGPQASVLIDAVEVADADDRAFMAAWEAARAMLRTCPGYLGARLHRSVMVEADFRFVDLAWWESPEAFAAAAVGGDLAETRSHRALYEVVRH
jgi:heme-degrading monooxygenase HmoA